ncbi:MAG: hypothetical protein N3D84_00505, partial [Candidatus Woesearchaeota archaeon]|nr:hypothetical protein [Candidatus Woesearchaeota archaeon]
MISVKEILKYPTGAWCVKRIAARPLMISSIARGFAQLKLKRYSILLNYYKNGEINWLTLIDDQDKINKLILNKHKKDRHYWKREFKKWLKKERKISQIFNKLRKKEIENIPDKEVIEDMMGFFKLQFESRRVSSLIDPYTFASEKILTELIRKFSENNPEVNQKEAFEILTKPESASFLNKVEIDLIKIAKEIKKDRKLAEGFKIKKIPPPILRKIKEHIEKFPWLKVESFFGAKEYTVDDVFEHIKGLLEKDLDEEERKNNMWKENKSIKKKYLLKHKFNKDIISIIELAPLFAEWQDMRKINTLMSTYIYSKYMKEISRRKGVEEDSIAYL